jgi:hypothetical protein
MFDRAARRYAESSRQWKWQLYAKRFPPRKGERVLDVGVSVRHDIEQENYFLRRYPFPDQLTGVGIDDVSTLREIYPGVTLIQADGRALPFADNEFDVVHSNAVVQLVGPHADQAQFVSELARVSSCGFVTTPNRWFPFDMHTRLPVVHWLPRSVMLAAFRRFGHQDQPWLLSHRSFSALFPAGVEKEIVVGRAFGWPATFNALFAKPLLELHRVGCRQASVKA